MNRFVAGLLFLLSLWSLAVESRYVKEDVLKLPSEASKFFHGGADDTDGDSVGTRWAVLIAGSNGYWNYRHQVNFFIKHTFLLD